MKRAICLLSILAALATVGPVVAQSHDHSQLTHTAEDAAEFPRDLQSYDDAGQGILARLGGRIATEPFNLVATIIFVLAIVHTFLSSKFREISYRLEAAHAQKVIDGTASPRSIAHRARVLRFLSEIEVVFGLWAIPLLVSARFFFDWPTVVRYVTHDVNYTEPMFVVVIMTLASTRPILKLSEAAMSRIARIFGGSLTAWWLTILTVGPLLGSFITEPAAMTICALLLGRKFYELDPNPRLKYATLGLLFVNVSVGGTLTHFAAPPILMVAGPWGWDTTHMLTHFGWRAAMGIVLSNALYWFVFRREFAALRERFAVRALKEEILTTHMPREVAERAIDSVIAEVQAERGTVLSEISGIVHPFTEKVKERLRDSTLKSLDEVGVDRDLAAQAFEQRFEKIRRHRYQRQIPNLLPPEQRAPFHDPDWDQREDPVPVWVMLVHVVFMGWTIMNAPHPARVLGPR